MSARRVVATAAAVIVVVAAAGWYSVQAFPMRGEQQLPPEALSDWPGPVESRARPITPENPIPRRTYSVPATEPAELRDGDSGGLVTVRVTLDESGQVAENRITRVSFRDGRVSVGLSGPTRESLDRLLTTTARNLVSDGGRFADGRCDDGVGDSCSTAVAVCGTRRGSPGVRCSRALRGAAPAAAPASTTTRVCSRDGAPAATPAAGDELKARADGSAPATAAAATSSRPGTIRRRRRRRRRACKGPEATSLTTRRLPRCTSSWRDHQAAGENEERQPDLSAGSPDGWRSGVVIIEARIEADGTVGRTRVLRSIPMLDDAAVEAVSQWQFTPTWLNGQPSPIVMTVTVNFTLQ